MKTTEIPTLLLVCALVPMPLLPPPLCNKNNNYRNLEPTAPLVPRSMVDLRIRFLLQQNWNVPGASTRASEWQNKNAFFPIFEFKTKHVSIP